MIGGKKKSFRIWLMLATQVLLSTREYPFPGVVEQPFLCSFSWQNIL